MRVARSGESMRRTLNREGFTLVELMIVVAIISTLAAIAIPNYLNFRLKSKTAEARTNIGTIRGLEIAYFAEHECWIAGMAETPRALAALDGGKAQWDLNTHFSLLGFAPESMVYYTYGISPVGTVYPDVSQGFTVHATGDLDDDSLLSIYQLNDTSMEIVRTGSGEF